MDEDDDLFDDADLLAIENHALAATQRPQSAADNHPASQDSDYGLGNGDDVIDLDASEDLAKPCPVLPPKHLSHTKPIPHPQKQSQTWHTSRSSPPVRQPVASWQQRVVPSRMFRSDSQTASRFEDHTSRTSTAAYSKNPESITLPNNAQAQNSSTLERVAKLEAELQSLRKSAEDAKSALYAKTGEISIVRSNHEKAAKDFERRLAIMQKTHAEEIAKQQAELDAARNDVQKSKTDQTFLEHDLKVAQEARKRMHKESQPRKQIATASTPQKTRAVPFRDGFDDDEVIVTTPTKSRERRKKEGTPKTQGKRKRADTYQQSPTKSLPLSGPASFEDALQTESMDIDYGLAPVDPEDVRSGPRAQLKEMESVKEKWDFARFILDHKSLTGDGRTVELLARYETSPADQTTMAASIYKYLASSSSPADALPFKVKFCQLIMDLWFQNFTTKRFASLKILVELLHDVVLDGRSELSGSLIPRIVTLAFTATDEISLKLIRAFKDPKRNQLPSTELLTDVPSLDYLELAETVALHGLPLRTNDESFLRKFWAAVPLETFIMLLNKAQPLDQILTALMMLQTSVLKDGFGPRVQAEAFRAQEDKDRQAKNEDSLLKRLTVLLFEDLLSVTSAQGYTTMDVLTLKHAILVFLEHLVKNPRGGQAMADHHLVIGRLARFIHERVVAMYAFNPVAHSTTVRLLNQSVKLLSLLTSRYGQSFDLRAKLAAVPGSEHMHLVALSKIAFAEGHSMLERGIEPEVAEAAHRMLDEHLSPDEGEAVMEVFSSAKSWNAG